MLLERFLRLCFAKGMSRLNFESNVEAFVLSETEFQERLIFDIDLVKTPIVNGDSFAQSLVCSESLMEQLVFMSLNIVVRLCSGERLYQEVVIEQSLVLDPRSSPVFESLNHVHYYRLSGFMYREHGGRLVTMFLCDGIWYNFDGGKVMRSNEGMRFAVCLPFFAEELV